MLIRYLAKTKSTTCVLGFLSAFVQQLEHLESELKPLMSAVGAIAVSTAECERGYSCMNWTVFDTRNSLAIPTVSSLMFLKLVGPPLHQFQPLLYVKSWLAKGRHAATDINSIAYQDEQDDKETEISAVWKFVYSRVLMRNAVDICSSMVSFRQPTFNVGQRLELMQIKVDQQV